MIINTLLRQSTKDSTYFYERQFIKKKSDGA